MARGKEEFSKTIIIVTTTNLTLSKTLSTMGLNFPTSEMTEGGELISGRSPLA